MQSKALPTRNGSTPISTRRVGVDAASLVWSVDNTRCPVRAAAGVGPVGLRGGVLVAGRGAAEDPGVRGAGRRRALAQVPKAVLLAVGGGKGAHARVRFPPPENAAPPPVGGHPPLGDVEV